MSDQRSHFSIRETGMVDQPQQIAQQQLYIPPERNSVLTSTNLLWMFTSWCIIFMNIIICGICIRDMVINTYTPIIHWFCSSIFVATIGGLIAIHNYIIKRK